MCGISGILYYDTSRQVENALLQRMIRSLRHRGPDDSGHWRQGNIGLAHTRLSIIDLSPLGHQPMSNEDGTVWIVFNGEIYNFQELRDELIARGHTFRSRTDTEAILHLWEEEGQGCVERLHGMFAFAIWDSRDQTLFLARDREGQKPLFYAALADRFVFGSEIKAILQDPEFEARPDLPAIHHYLAYQSVPAPYCAFEGIEKLPPAHTLRVDSRGISLRRYWKLSYRNQFSINGKNDLEVLQEEIITRLREAVRIRLMSDVPMGAFLSGGIDSSIIVALMAGLMDQPVKTFSIGFTQEEYNETHYARMVADRYGTEHHQFVVTPDAEAIFPELIWHYNEPFADSSAIPTYYVSKMAREYVTVVLSGDAGDENFAGYPRYQHRGAQHIKKSRILAILSRFASPEQLWKAFISNGSWRNSFRRLKASQQQKYLYYLHITHFNELYQAQLYTPAFRQHLGDLATVDLLYDKYQQSDARHFLDATLDVDFSLYLPDTLMTKMDIASMIHSLEVRAPMLDHQFMEFTARIPPELKLKDGTIGKYIFKKAVEPYLPHEVIYRPKMGFGVPLDHWFRNELKELAYDTLLSQRAADRGYFRPAYIESLLDRHQQGESWQYLIWNLLILEFWHLMFIDGLLANPYSNNKWE